MPPKAIIIIGEVYKHLTVVGEGPRTKWGRTITCRCSCGKIVNVGLSNFRNGQSRSCGCKKGYYITQSKIRHGKAETRTYRIWSNMKDRCSNPRNNRYDRYGGRGIKVCDRWLHSFENFYEDMGECPAGMSIDRKDGNGNYELSNCKWATPKEQANNTRRNLVITFKGISQTAAQWARETGISYFAITQRVHSGWSADKTLTTPLSLTHKRYK